LQVESEEVKEKFEAYEETDRNQKIIIKGLELEIDELKKQMEKRAVIVEKEVATDIGKVVKHAEPIVSN
jgi:hypothetical protein